MPSGREVIPKSWIAACSMRERSLCQPASMRNQPASERTK
jgi:hypothetical protein